MFASQITAIVTNNPKTRKHFQGVFSCDKIPDMKKTKIFYMIVNTTSSETFGEHWTLYFKRNTSNMIYVDSLAKNPKEYGQCFEKAYEKLTKNCNVHKLENPLQSDSSSLCGVYCIFFVFYLSLGISINTIQKKFFNKVRLQNDKKLCCWLNKFIKIASLTNIIKTGQLCKCYLKWKK